MRAVWQPHAVLTDSLQSAALHFTAEQGKTYYLRIKDSWNREQKAEKKLAPVNSEEGPLLSGQNAQSTSKKK